MQANQKPTPKYAATKVPQITIFFWGVKLLTTGMGEAISDFLGDKSIVVGGLVGIFGTLLALRLQLKQDRFRAAYYWGIVAMIAVSGTMTADVIHDGPGIPYGYTVALFAIFTAVVFTRWYRSEGTLDIHSIDTRRRETFYWVTVYASFTLGTAAGDFTATSLNLGFFPSILLFSAVILIPLIGWWRFNWNPIFAFWFAYVDTRPIGASFADWFSKPHNISGLNFGDGHTSLCALIVFIGLVLYAIKTEHGIQPARARPEHSAHDDRTGAGSALAPEAD